MGTSRSGEEGKEKRNRKRLKCSKKNKIKEAKGIFIKAADYSYCNCLSRAVPFNRAINLRNQMGDEIDKKKKRHSGIPSLQRHLTFVMTFELV